MRAGEEELARDERSVSRCAAPGASDVIAMRGSTAGLGDGAADGSRAHAACLTLLDAAIASIVVAPAVVLFWRSIWVLADVYLMPGRPIASALASAVGGFLVGLLACAAQTPLRRLFRPERARLTFYVASRLYTLALGVACVSSWRGMWQLTDAAVGATPRATLASLAAALAALAALRCVRNLCSPPFFLLQDRPATYFDVPTMFRTSTREPALYVLDCLFSVVVVGSLVIFVWRGAWVLMDIYLCPEDIYKSNWASLVLGYILAAGSFALQTPARWAAARLRGAAKLALADLFLLLAFLATVNVWRSVWGLTDLYFLPESPKLSNWICFVGSYVLLVLLNCSNTLLVRGVYIDAEEPGGECVIFPCHYLRLFFHRERAKMRQRRALLLAAARKAELDSPAAHAVVPMLDSPVVDKV